jgi:hypothetical protein
MSEFANTEENKAAYLSLSLSERADMRAQYPDDTALFTQWTAEENAAAQPPEKSARRAERRAAHEAEVMAGQPFPKPLNFDNVRGPGGRQRREQKERLAAKLRARG